MTENSDKRDRFRLPQRAAWRQAGAGRRRVPLGGRPLRPDERPDVGRPAPGLEGRAGRRGSTRRSATRLFALLDVAGGTGDIAFRIVEAGGAGRPGHRRSTSTARCWRSGASAPQNTRPRRAVDFRRGQCRGTAVRRPQLRRRTRSPSASATCRGSTRRCARPTACCKPGGRFLCLEFSAVDVPVLDRLYELYSFNVIPAIGRRGRPATPSPIAISSNRSASSRSRQALRRDDRATPDSRRVTSSPTDRRHRRDAFRLEAVTRPAHVVSTISALFAARPRRLSCSRAKACSRSSTRRPLPAPARLRLRLARLIERPAQRAAGRSGLAAALTRLGPTYVKLGQFLATRPDVVGAAMAPRPRKPAGPDGAVPAGARPTRVDRGGARQAGRRGSTRRFGAAGRGRLDRAGAQGRDRRRGRTARRSRSRCCGPASSSASGATSNAFYFAARTAEAIVAEARRLRPVEVVGDAARARSRSRWISGSRPPRCPRWPRTPATIPDFRVPAVDWDRTARDVLTLEWIDGISCSNDRARSQPPGIDLPALGRTVIQTFLRHALRDGFFHADMHPGNLFVDEDGRLVAVDFGIMGRLGPKERRFLAEILYGFITRDYRRIAEVHFEAGYVPAHHSVEDFAQAIRAIGEPIHDRTADDISMAQAADAAVRGHRACSTCRRGRNCSCCRRPWWWSKASRARSIRSSTCGRRRSRWCATGSSAISARAASSRTRATAPARSAACSAQVPRCSSRAGALLEQLDAMTRNGLVLAPETVDGDRPRRSPPQPLVHGRAVGDRRPGCHGCFCNLVIALHAMHALL